MDRSGAADRETAMLFRQSGFASAADRDRHEGGWNECFDKLEEHLATVEMSARH